MELKTKSWLGKSVTHDRGNALKFSKQEGGVFLAMDEGSYNVKAEKPYYAISNKEFSLLSTNKDSVRILRELGYDSLVMSDSIGVVSLAMPFGEQQIQMVDLEKPSMKVSEPTIFGLYHATNEFFLDFEIGDIGYHFGTRSAAIQRSKKLYEPEIEIYQNDLSISNDLYEFVTSKSDREEDRIAKLILRKIEHPSRSRILSAIEKIPKSELPDIETEYSMKSDSQAFKKMEKSSSEKTFKYTCMVSESPIQFNSDHERKVLVSAVNNSFMKKVDLTINSPYRMDDLGEWKLSLVVSECAVISDENKNHIYRLQRERGDSDALSYFHEVMGSLGYDGIVYKNEVEDAGKDSYIAFFPEQVRVLPYKQKLYGNVFKVERDSSYSL